MEETKKRVLEVFDENEKLTKRVKHFEETFKPYFELLKENEELKKKIEILIKKTEFLPPLPATGLRPFQP